MISYPSIFNDVIGPVMRGPSSSHCAAALRIGRIARDLMNNDINEVHIKYDPNGSLVTTHESQGSDMGLYSGLLGFETDDERLLNYKEEIIKSGIKIKIEYEDIHALHPNTYGITLKNNLHTHEIVAISSGGGMIEITSVDGAALSIRGDYFETLVFIRNEDEKYTSALEKLIHPEYIVVRKGKNIFFQIKSICPIEPEIIEQIKGNKGVLYIKQIAPVLPVLSRSGMKVPFITADEMIEYNKDKNLELWQLALEYESARGNVSKNVVFEKMRGIVKAMAGSITIGLHGTEYKDRILPSQSPNYKKLMDAGRLIGGDIHNLIAVYVSAIMEVKSSMGVIVAAPTAGSCGSVAGPVIATAHYLKQSEETIVKAMLIAGLIGVFIASRSTFAAEDAGCQAECGSGSGMAAAAIAFLGGGNVNHSLSAASLALQNSFGMTCDPIASRVEAPCLGKNVLAGVNALACANMALADYNQLIPFDEVIEAFDKTGRSLPRELRCTALGGLSQTKSSKEIEKNL
jgi:L-serine dehydratase